MSAEKPPGCEQETPESVAAENIELSKREATSERQGLQEIYINQLKENNQVLKDLIRNKNKEVISLELQMKKDKLAHRKETQGLKKQVQLQEADLKQYQNFVRSLFTNFLEIAVPVITDDIQIVNDCSHLLYIPEKFSELGDLVKRDKLLPEGFEQAVTKLREEVKQMQDQDQGDEEYGQEGDEEYEQEQQDEADIYDQVYQPTEPIFRKHLRLEIW